MLRPNSASREEACFAQNQQVEKKHALSIRINNVILKPLSGTFVHHFLQPNQKPIVYYLHLQKENKD